MYYHYYKLVLLLSRLYTCFTKTVRDLSSGSHCHSYEKTQTISAGGPIFHFTTYRTSESVPTIAPLSRYHSSVIQCHLQRLDLGLGAESPNATCYFEISK